MPSIKCKCGTKIRYGEIPNPNEWLTISDGDYDTFSGQIDAEELYKAMKSLLRCQTCGRLWAFWDGFDHDPVSYLPEFSIDS